MGKFFGIITTETGVFQPPNVSPIKATYTAAIEADERTPEDIFVTIRDQAVEQAEGDARTLLLEQSYAEEAISLGKTAIVFWSLTPNEPLDPSMVTN